MKENQAYDHCTKCKALNSPTKDRDNQINFKNLR